MIIFFGSAMIWLMTIILKCVFMVLWFILKYTFFLMPLLVVKGVPIMLKILFLPIILLKKR